MPHFSGSQDEQVRRRLRVLEGLHYLFHFDNLLRNASIEVKSDEVALYFESCYRQRTRILRCEELVSEDKVEALI